MKCNYYYYLFVCIIPWAVLIPIYQNVYRNNNNNNKQYIFTVQLKCFCFNSKQQFTTWINHYIRLIKV